MGRSPLGSPRVIATSSGEAQLVDDPPGHLSREPWLAFLDAREPIVEQQDDQAPRVEIVRGDVNSDVTHPRRGRLDAIGQRDFTERDDRLRLSAFEHREVRHGEPTDRAPLPVEDEDVERHHVDTRPEDRLLRSRVLPRDRRQAGSRDETHDERPRTIHRKPQAGWRA
jgi:hypothetical protein